MSVLISQGVGTVFVINTIIFCSYFWCYLCKFLILHQRPVCILQLLGSGTDFLLVFVICEHFLFGEVRSFGTPGTETWERGWLMEHWASALCWEATLLDFQITFPAHTPIPNALKACFFFFKFPPRLQRSVLLVWTEWLTRLSLVACWAQGAI